MGWHMKTSFNQIILCSVAASGLLMLGACSQNASDDAADNPAPAATTPASQTPMDQGMPAAPGSSIMPAGSGSSMMSPPAGGSTQMPASASTAGYSSTTSSDTTASFAVTKVTVGDSLSHQKVSKAAEVIAPNQNSIYASVDTTGKTDGSTLSARWSYLDGKKQLVSAISQSIATTGPATTTFTIKNPKAWPQGTYKVDIAVNGEPVSSKRFEVKSPA